MRYFWREKNALSCIGKGKIINPTKEELGEELILKLWQKLDRVEIIYNKDARRKYWEQDEKPKKIKLEDYSEKKLQQLIGMNVVVEFLQLIHDLCQFNKIDFNALKKQPQNLNFNEVKQELRINIEKIDGNIKIALNNILNIILSLINLLNLNYDIVEKKRLEKEKKQGNFYNGKYVLIEI